MEERYEQFRTACRTPYQSIGMIAYGSKMSKLVSTCVQFTLIGSMVVILLLASQIITNIAYSSTGMFLFTIDKIYY